MHPTVRPCGTTIATLNGGDGRVIIHDQIPSMEPAVTLSLESFAARLPEVGASPRHGFVLFDLVGVAPGPTLPPYRALSDDAPRPSPRALTPRAPLCLALAIDASSSMRGPRFALALQAARDVVESLSLQDRLAVITFDRGARTVLGPTPLDADGKQEARSTLDRLATSSGTNLAAGWREAADALSRLIVPDAVKRVLMLTDGLPSIGERDAGVITRMVAEGRARGVETSVAGIGDGIDEKLCAQLSRAGDGRFYYLRNEGLLGDVIAHEVDGARRLAATEVSLVMALSLRVTRAEVLHRYPCQTDGRTLEVRVGAVPFEHPRSVLMQVEVDDPAHDAILGAAMARGRAIVDPRAERTRAGYPLGAKPGGDGGVESERLSVVLPAGVGDEESRRRVARAVLALRTLAEIRSAWDGFDARHVEAVTRRLGRARALRKVLTEAGLFDPTATPDLPDLDAIEAAMLGRGLPADEARRGFTSWAHNTQNSQIVPVFNPKGPPKE